MDDFLPFTPVVMTITALTNYLRKMLESDEILQDVWVKGEISNFSPSRSGHIYFTLKDNDSQLRAVMWKQSALRLRFDPQDGQAVEAHGYISFYASNGQLQLYVDSMRPAGEGTLFQEFSRLKARLEGEGLFDQARKRALPSFPRHIGVVTSPSGAALQDILNTLGRRLPLLRVSLAPTAVQGAEAPAGIVKALNQLNQIADLDLIIVARGGGSIEDLWAFNDENVARTIAASRLPVIAGVGHETDFTIADFVADLRAPTPTAAAELATPITRLDLLANLQATSQNLDLVLSEKVRSLSADLQIASLELKRNSPMQRVYNNIQRHDDLRERLDRAVQAQLKAKELAVAALGARLAALNPTAVLSRGFAIVSSASTGKIISKTTQTLAGQSILIRFQDGTTSAIVQDPSGGTHANQ
jgi:exodeoxyribonuclease VII large subunit